MSGARLVCCVVAVEDGEMVEVEDAKVLCDECDYVAHLTCLDDPSLADDEDDGNPPYEWYCPVSPTQK
jgi:hypothetical protein